MVFTKAQYLEDVLNGDSYSGGVSGENNVLGESCLMDTTTVLDVMSRAGSNGEVLRERCRMESPYSGRPSGGN